MTEASINVTISPCSRSLLFYTRDLGELMVGGAWEPGPSWFFWLPCLYSACPGSAGMPLPLGEALWGGQEVRGNHGPLWGPALGSLRVFHGNWCPVRLPAIWLTGGSLATKIAFLASPKRFAWCWYCPYFRQGCHVLRAQGVSRVGKGFSLLWIRRFLIKISKG